MRRFGRLVAAIMLIGGAPLAAAPPDAAIVNSRPTSLPSSSRSPFEASLRCMDDLLSRSRSNYNVSLLLAPFNDAKGNSGVVTRDLLAASLARMTERSRFFSIYPQTSRADNTDPNATLLLGSITGVDDAVQSKGGGGGISIGPFSFGDERQRIDGVLTVTLYFADAKGAILPGTMQTLSMSLRSEQRSNDLSAGISSVGGSFSMSFGRKDGVLPAARALIDLAAIQATAAYAAVPPERCLALVAAAPGAGLRARYDKLKSAQSLAAIADGLVQRGYLRPPAPRSMTPELSRAIAEFEVANGLPPLGQPSFDVWAAIGAPASQVASAPAAAPAAAASMAAPSAAAALAAAPRVRIAPRGVHLKAAFADGTHYTIQIGLRAELGVTVTRPAHLVCFHIDQFRRATRIFPNAQRPDRVIQPGEVLPIPGPEDQFVIENDALGDEQVMCAASVEPFRLPGAMAAVFDPASTASSSPGKRRAPVLTEQTPTQLRDALVGADNRIMIDNIHIVSCRDPDFKQCAVPIE